MTPPALYQIADWDEHFESAKSRLIQRCANTYAPNKHGGSGWSNVMGEEDGAAIWGIWKMLLDICSRQMRPREGWLTADGKKNGRRLSARELSNQLRRPIDEIHRALRILRSPEVAFMRLVEGQPEDIAQAPDGYHEDTKRVVGEQSAEVHHEDTALPSEYPAGVSRRDIQRRIEEQKEVLSQGPENGEHKKDTSPSCEGHPEDTAGILDVVQHAEAKLILGKLAKDVFPDEAQGAIWDNRLDHELCEILPISRQLLEKVDWCYRLTEGDRMFEDGPRGGGMMRVKSFTSLITNLRKEASKVTAARRKLGLNGLHAPKKEAAPEPARWQEAFVALWGERPDRPGRFEELTMTQRAAVLGKCGELEALA